MKQRLKKVRCVVVVAGLVVATAGCETMQTSAEVDTGPLAAAPAPAVDTIAQYAVGATRGSTTVIQSPDRGSVTIKVGDDYVSAAGNRCKRVTLSDATGWLQINAVCLNDSSWATVVEL